MTTRDQTERTPAATGPQPMSAVTRGGLVLALVVHTVLLGHAATRLTVTHDEYWHLPIGLAMWRTGQFDQDRINPPLVRLWGAIPLAVGGAEMRPIEPDLGEVAYGDALREADPSRYRRWVFAGRLMILPLSLTTGLLLFFWMRRNFGTAPAWLALLLWLICPNVLAHASLMTHDLAAAAGFLAVPLAVEQWWRRGDRLSALLAGAVLGLALLTKYTLLLLVPLMLVWWCCGAFAALRRWCGLAPLAERRRWETSGQFALLLLALLLVVNSCYLWQGTFTPLDDLNVASARLRQWQAALGPLAHVPVPLPRDYLLGLDQLFHFVEQSHPVYLDGEWRNGGFRHYYLRGLTLKLPHGFQMAILIGLLVFARHLNNASVRRAAILVALPALLLVAAASLSDNQLGLRYILPAFPALCVLAGGMLFRETGTPPPLWRTGLAVLVLVAGVGALRHHPHHLAYFNEFAGGPELGRWHLADSNLDWGQALDDARKQVDDPATYAIAYFGTFPPAAAGFTGPPPPAHVPEPGRYLVSVNYVVGRPHALRRPDGSHRAVGLDEFGYFRFFEPVQTVGGSIDIYHLTEADAARWRSAAQAAGLIP